MEQSILPPEYVISLKLWSLIWKILIYCWLVIKQLKINRKSKIRLMDQQRYVPHKCHTLETVWDVSVAKCQIFIMILLLKYARPALRKIFITQQQKDAKKQ